MSGNKNNTFSKRLREAPPERLSQISQAFQLKLANRKHVKQLNAEVDKRIDAQIVYLFNQEKTVNQIAREMVLTRERVRNVITAFLNSPKALSNEVTQAQEQKEAAEQLEEETNT